VPVQPGDRGDRPALDHGEYYNTGIEVHSTESGGPPPGPGTYEISATVRNSGSAAVYSGVAEFYVGPQDALDEAIGAPRGRRPGPLGRSSFQVVPGQEIRVACPILWSPGTVEESKQTALVHVYDLLVDRIRRRFDPLDRHVGRLDQPRDLRGRWYGSISSASNAPTPTGITAVTLVPTLVYMVITQEQQYVSAAIQTKWPPTNQSVAGTGTGVLVDRRTELREELASGQWARWELALDDADPAAREIHVTLGGETGILKPLNPHDVVDWQPPVA
jgi:hypothetical protein